MHEFHLAGIPCTCMAPFSLWLHLAFLSSWVFAALQKKKSSKDSKKAKRSKDKGKDKKKRKEKDKKKKRKKQRDKSVSETEEEGDRKHLAHSKVSILFTWFQLVFRPWITVLCTCCYGLGS